MNTMFSFSNKSKRNLDTCDTRLQEVMNEVIQHYDCSILEGHRTEELQNAYYKKRLSKLKYPDSKHNKIPSLAVDAVPYPVNWKQTERMAHFAGFVLGVAQAKGITLRWGADWDRDGDIREHGFRDYPHFELVNT